MLLRCLAPLLLHQRAQPVLEGHLDQDAGGGAGEGRFWGATGLSPP